MSKKRKERIIAQTHTHQQETILAVNRETQNLFPDVDQWTPEQMRLWSMERAIGRWNIKDEDLYTRADELAEYVRTGAHPAKANDEDRTDS